MSLCATPFLLSSTCSSFQAGCTHEWTRSASTGEAALLSGEERDLAAGEQVFVDYGRGVAKCSWEHLFSHGFVPEARGMRTVRLHAS